MTCPKCGQPIECPNEGYDTLIDCPSCGGRILARPEIDEREFSAKAKSLPKAFIQPVKERRDPMLVRKVISVILVVAAGVLIGWGVYMLRGVLPAMLGGTAGLAIVILLVYWAVLWFLFPVFMYFGMRKQEALLRKIEENTRPHDKSR